MIDHEGNDDVHPDHERRDIVQSDHEDSCMHFLFRFMETKQTHLKTSFSITKQQTSSHVSHG